MAKATAKKKATVATKTKIASQKNGSEKACKGSKGNQGQG
jgi:hypothetical protein